MAAVPVTEPVTRITRITAISGRLLRSVQLSGESVTGMARNVTGCDGLEPKPVTVGFGRTSAENGALGGVL